MANSMTRVLAAGALLLAVALACAPVDAHDGCHGEAAYKVKFYFKWTAATHPRSYPKGGHFSPPTVASHSSAYQMWAPGSFASQGIQNVAETGNPMVLRRELGVYMKAGHVGKYDGTKEPTKSGMATVVLRAKVGPSTPYLSAATMAAPSPDWFTGFHDLDMCGRWGGWRYRRSGPLILYDSGTDSGRKHKSEDKKTYPPTTIFSLRRGFPAFGRPFGWYVIKRVR